MLLEMKQYAFIDTENTIVFRGRKPSIYAGLRHFFLASGDLVTFS